MIDREVRLVKADLSRSGCFSLGAPALAHEAPRERNLHSEVVSSLNRSSLRRSVAQSLNRSIAKIEHEPRHCANPPDREEPRQAGMLLLLLSLPQPEHCRRRGGIARPGPCAAMDGSTRAYMDVLAAGPGMASPSRLAREHMEAASALALALAFGVWRLAFGV